MNVLLKYVLLLLCVFVITSSINANANDIKPDYSVYYKGDIQALHQLYSQR